MCVSIAMGVSICEAVFNGVQSPMYDLKSTEPHRTGDSGRSDDYIARILDLDRERAMILECAVPPRALSRPESESATSRLSMQVRDDHYRRRCGGQVVVVRMSVSSAVNRPPLNSRS